MYLLRNTIIGNAIDEPEKEKKSYMQRAIGSLIDGEKRMNQLTV